jgi:hypothetical protein
MAQKVGGETGKKSHIQNTSYTLSPLN